MRDQNLFGNLIRLHILHHASKQAIFGLWLIEELAHHGYRISPGTLYPLLHSMEQTGYLSSAKSGRRARIRRLYRITQKGRIALKEAKVKVKELFSELLEE